MLSPYAVKCFETHLLGVGIEQSLESLGSACDFRIHMSGYEALIRLRPLSPNAHAPMFERGRPSCLRSETIAKEAPYAIGILAIGSDIEMVGFGFFHDCSFFI